MKPPPTMPRTAGLAARLHHGSAAFMPGLPFIQAIAVTRRALRAPLRRPKTAFVCQSAVPPPEPWPHGLRRTLQPSSFHPPAACAPPGAFPPLASRPHGRPRWGVRRGCESLASSAGGLRFPFPTAVSSSALTTCLTSAFICITCSPLAPAGARIRNKKTFAPTGTKATPPRYHPGCRAGGRDHLGAR